MGGVWEGCERGVRGVWEGCGRGVRVTQVVFGR